MRYFFNIRNGQGLVRDPDGTDYLSDEDACEEALAIARELIGRLLISGDRVDWSSVVEIDRDDGLSAGTVGFLEAIGLPPELMRPLS